MFIKPKSVANSCLQLSIKGIYYLNICVTKNKIQWNLTFVDEVFYLPFIVLRLTFLWPPTVKRAAKPTGESCEYHEERFELKRDFSRTSIDLACKHATLVGLCHVEQFMLVLLRRLRQIRLFFFYPYSSKNSEHLFWKIRFYFCLKQGIMKKGNCLVFLFFGGSINSEKSSTILESQCEKRLVIVLEKCQ